jgi:Flp pilus assembly protein protease CpaA
MTHLSPHMHFSMTHLSMIENACSIGDVKYLPICHINQAVHVSINSSVVSILYVAAYFVALIFINHNYKSLVR